MEITDNMDSDEGSKQKKNSDSITDGSDVLPPPRVRCSILHAPKDSRFLRSYHFVFLPCISIILWAVYLLVGN